MPGKAHGEANGLSGLRIIGAEELREIEPHASGLQALVVPSTGVTDYARVCEKYAELISAGGGTVLTSAATGIRRLAGDDPGVMIVPFRGEYYGPCARACLAGAGSDLSRARPALSISSLG